MISKKYIYLIFILLLTGCQNKVENLELIKQTVTVDSVLSKNVFNFNIENKEHLLNNISTSIRDRDSLISKLKIEHYILYDSTRNILVDLLEQKNKLLKYQLSLNKQQRDFSNRTTQYCDMWNNYRSFNRTVEEKYEFLDNFKELIKKQRKALNQIIKTENSYLIQYNDLISSELRFQNSVKNIGIKFQSTITNLESQNKKKYKKITKDDSKAVKFWNQPITQLLQSY